MRKTSALAGVLVVSALGFTAALAQPVRPPAAPGKPPANQPDTRPGQMPQMPKPPAKPAAPSSEPRSAPPSSPAEEPPERQLLARTTGEYVVKMTVYLEPGGQPVVFDGVATREFILGGKFILERLESRDEKRPFGMMTTIGFNAEAHDGPRFEIVRYTSLAPCAMPEAGRWDADKHAIRSRGEHEMAGMAAQVRAIETHQSDDHFTLEMHASYEGYSEQFKDLKVPEYKTMVLEYQRKP